MFFVRELDDELGCEWESSSCEGDGVLASSSKKKVVGEASLVMMETIL